jgi:multiple sugar transport system permease protein
MKKPDQGSKPYGQTAPQKRPSASDAIADLRRSERRAGWVLAAPFGMLFLLTFLLPLSYALWTSLYRDRLIGGSIFVGLGSYARALTDPLLWSGLLRMVFFGAMQIPLIIGMALVAALLIDSGASRLRRFFRVGIFLPYAVPSVVASLMWGYIYGPTFGPFAQLAQAIGLQPLPFLSSTYMLPSLANVATWEYTGYNAIILFAGLQAISPELYEAAAIDGASRLQVALLIKLPALRPTLLLTLVFALIGTFQYFAEPQIFSALAPDVIVPSFTPNLYAYSLAFVGQEYSYSAALSFVLGIIVVVVSTVFIRVTSQQPRAN